MKSLRIAFDALPLGRWGPLFHVLRRQHPDTRLQWRRTAFPTWERLLLETADVGLFVEPPREPGLSALTIETSPMFVLVAVGHPLAQNNDLHVADVLDQPFPGSPTVHPEWRAFWTLDEQRGGAALLTSDRVENPDDELTVVASGRAIATIPATLAEAMPHPGVLAIPLSDGPLVSTRLVWRSDDENPVVRSLIRLAAEITGNGRPDSTRRARSTPAPPAARLNA
ncbi:MAG TPA: LysR substrate-binding domain-containing protein [Baekduia sp.]|uniref:LysR substrate-binding domain-containing protein n=1 Tax=Baekduia sp. TaxID=2600305 RepID=UPI002D1C9B58|nr:LysR substrate-binding domain-containing protein [Baekduia sp.]HMJ36503.1 LysR substrate-binding domain-containing protein [Baekduia sp.]